MTETRHLRNAPIIEALIDMRVAIPSYSLDSLAGLCDKVRDRFPDRKTIHRGQLTLQINTQEKSQPNASELVHAVLGFICSSSDGTRKVQFRGDGFTFNKLKPYQSWEQMRDEARELWALYSETVANGLPVQRVALRYINHLDIRAGTPLSEYLLSPPTVPEGLPQGVTEYLNRLVLEHHDLGAAVIVTQNLQPSKAQKDSMNLLFDIDVFRENANLKHDEVWGVLEGFHTFKNEIFFKSITEKTAESYQ